MIYTASVTPTGLSIQVEGLEVEAIFGGPVAGGPVDFTRPANDLELRDAVVARMVRYCEENLLPAPPDGAVLVLTNVL